MFRVLVYEIVNLEHFSVDVPHIAIHGVIYALRNVIVRWHGIQNCALPVAAESRSGEQTVLDFGILQVSLPNHVHLSWQRTHPER